MSVPIVSTQNGKFQGATENGVCVWRGIPYARAPKRELRFRAPQPIDPWIGVQDATRFGTVCPQPPSQLNQRLHVAPEPADEDCLFLNIWSPAADDKARPVMFWIHGGGYSTGSGSLSAYNGSGFAHDGDVVFVSINYRLGPFGFLYFKGLPGDTRTFDTNVGIRDQIAALQWGKANIRHFGGDPNQIMIFGESAGAGSVVTHLGSPASKGLFQRAIAESAIPWMVFDPPTATLVVKKYLGYLDIAPENFGTLRQVPVAELIDASRKLINDCADSLAGTSAYQPTIDGDLLPQHPMDAIAAGNAQGVPLLIGTNHDETNIFGKMHPSVLPVTTQQVDTMFERLNPSAEVSIIAAYKNYPRKAAVLALGRDAVFRIPSIRVAEAQSKYAPVWMYRFDWVSPPLRVLRLDAFHALELAFIFRLLDTKATRALTLLTNKRRALALSQRMHQAWINFARTGKPNASGSDEWEPYDMEKRATLLWNLQDTLAYDPDAAQREAWQGVSVRTHFNEKVPV